MCMLTINVERKVGVLQHTGQPSKSTTHPHVPHSYKPMICATSQLHFGQALTTTLASTSHYSSVKFSFVLEVHADIQYNMIG